VAFLCGVSMLLWALLVIAWPTTMILEEGAMGKVMAPYSLSLSLTYPVVVVVDDDEGTGQNMSNILSQTISLIKMEGGKEI